MTGDHNPGATMFGGDMPVEDLLPAELPIFPLTGVLLLPGATLPLNIFEPRYLNMIEDALGSGRVIGMVQPKSTGMESPEGKVVESPDGEPAVYRTGCAGRIISFSETGDGRFAITLLGLCRFRIAEELKLLSGYRRVSPDYSLFYEDLEDDENTVPHRESLLTTVEAYFLANGIDADWSTIEGAADSALVTTLSMLCPFGPSEKQALLECEDTTARGELLGNLMSLSLHGDAAHHGVRH